MATKKKRKSPRRKAPRGKPKKRSRKAPAKRACKYGLRSRGLCPRGTPSQRRKDRHAAMPHRVGKCPEYVWMEVEKNGCITVGQAYRESDGKLRGPACNACPDDGGDEACLTAMLNPQSRPKGCPHPKIVQREVVDGLSGCFDERGFVPVPACRGFHVPGAKKAKKKCPHGRNKRTGKCLKRKRR